MHLIERIIWIIGAIITLGVLVWAFAPAVNNSGRVQDSEGGSWFAKPHATLRSVGDNFH